MENAYELYFHRLFSINPYRSLRMKLCEMSFCKDWPHTDRGEPYPIVREVGAALGEKVEDGRIAFSADAPGERARLIGRFFPYASSEVCVDALDGEGARVGLEFAVRSGRGSPYTAEDAPGLCVFVERAGAEVCVCHEEFVGGRSLGVVRHGTRAFTPGGVLFVSAHGAFFDVSLGREFVCTIQAEGFSDICRRSAFMNAGVSLYVALPAGGRAAVSRAESFLDGGLSHADMKPVRYEDGTPILENGRLFLTLSSRLQAGAYQYVVSWNPSTCELRPEGAIFFDYGDGRWCADVAISLIYHRERREWLFWATAFSHGHILCHGTSAGDPRFGITVLDATLMEAQKPGSDVSNGGLPIQTSGAEKDGELAQTKDCACGKAGAARAFASDEVLSVQAGVARISASDDVLSVQAGGRVAEMDGGQAQTKECACGKVGAARAFASDDVLSVQVGAARASASDDVLSVQAGGRVAEMDDGLTQAEDCACGKVGAARAFASDDVLSVQAGGRVAEMADGQARTKDCACGKVGAARASASDDVLSAQAGWRVAEIADGQTRTEDCACGKVGAARAFASDEVLSVQAGAARAYASDDVLSVQAGGRVAEMDGGLAQTKDCACGKAGAARASASDEVLSAQAGWRVAEMDGGLARTEDCACGKAGAARASASDDVLSAQAGWRVAEIADGQTRTEDCACGKVGAARAFASDEVLSVQAGGRVAEMDGGQAQTKECACGKAGAARAFASDEVLSVQAGVARISASDEVLSVQAGGRVAEMADGQARTEDCACGKAGAVRAFASDDVLSVQVGAARASASDDVLSVQAGRRGASVAELDDDTLWLAKTGDEDPDFTYDRERGKWYMTICRSVKGAGYRYFLFESDEPFSGYRHVCHTESGENTGGLMVRIRGRRALVCGSDFKARAEYRVYPLGDFSHFQRLTCDFDDGGFRGWGSLMPVPCGNRTKYVWMTFDRHNGSDYNWSYGNLYAYEAEEMDSQ